MNKIIAVAVTSLVVIVLVAGVLIPIIDPETSDEEKWYYDDYKLPAKSISSVSGAIEIVDVGGTDYLHASDIGSATIEYADGTIDEITVNKAQLDVFFLYGQSNASYRNGDITKVDLFPALGTTYFFGYEDAYGPPKSLNSTGFDVSLCDMYSLYDSDGVLRVGGILPDFAYTYQEITGHKVYLIDGAIGGKSITTFDPPNGQLWEYGDSILTAGLAEIDTEHFDYTCNYYIWIQGESDTNRDPADYASRFLEMHDALLSGDMAGVHFKKCFMSKVRAVNGVKSSQAQIELAKNNPTIVMATELSDTFTMANGLMGDDDLHYSQLGNNLLGVAIAESIGRVVNPPVAELDEFSDLLKAIPIMIFVALILGAAALVFKSRQF